MNRKILLLISIFALGTAPFVIGGCSSSDEKVADEASMSDDGLDGAELTDDGAAPANPDSTADVSGTPAEAPPPADGGNPDDIVADLGDDPTAEGMAPDPGADALPDQALGNDAPPPTDVADNNVPPPADSMPTDAPPAEGDLAAPPPLGADTSMPSAPKASLKKVKDTPFNSGGRILNTVYVARKGDTLNKVAEKLFGDKKRKKELLADNSMLSRGVKEGDKIYYNSPRRPDDTTTMMNYFEDNGIPAQSYISKDGDNLKNVAKELLGSKDGWKELWVTNPNLESKGGLDPNTEIRYWSQASDTTVAANTPPPPTDAPPVEPPPPPIAAGTTNPTDLNNLPPPSDSLPPPPPAPTDTAAIPPPPPPPDQLAANNEFPPPPPPPPGLNGANGKKPASPESFLFQDQETTMALGAGAIILLSVLLIIVHRIKRGRAQRMRLGQTQV